MNSQTDVNQRTRIAGAIAGITVLGTMGLTFPFVFSRSPLPYMATPGAKIRKALLYLRDNGHRSAHFVDLGSGDGQGVYEAVRAGYKKAVGIELNSTMLVLSQIRRLLWKKQYRSCSKLVRGDLFRYNLEGADTIMVFGVKPLMDQISEKVARESKPGTHVLSYRFHLPVTTGSCSDGSLKPESGLSADLVYNHQEMRIYKVK